MPQNQRSSMQRNQRIQHRSKRFLSRRSLSLTRLVVVILVAAIFVGCRSDIQHELDEREATTLCVLLETSGIAADKDRDRDGAWSVSVPNSDVHRARVLMLAHGLPRRDTSEGLHDDSVLIPTAAQERLWVERHRAAELEQSLLAVDGVLEAHVHLVLPEAGNLLPSSNQGDPRASVLLVYRTEPGENGDAGSRPISSALVVDLVVGSVDGLDPADVSVLLTPRQLPTAEDVGVAQIGPITVSRASHRTAQIILALLLGLVLILGASLVLIITRRRPRPSVALTERQRIEQNEAR